MSTTYKNITEKAVMAIGSPSAVSRMFGFKSPQSIFNWIIRNRVPSERVIRLCELGEWIVTPHDLRLICTLLQLVGFQKKLSDPKK